MIQARRLLARVLLGSFVLMGAHASTLMASDSFVVGGFDESRAGIYSFQDGASLSAARDSLATNFAGSSLTSFPTLSDTSLSGVDIVVIGSARTIFASITPLTDAEQTALYDYVAAGGNALLLTDNDTFGTPVNDPDTANDSLVAAFGMGTGGTTNVVNVATVANPAASPVTSGPFGTISSVTTFYPGNLDLTGSAATELASNAKGSVLAVIARGAIAPGSGAVVVVSDHNVFHNEPSHGKFSLNENLFLNTIDYLCQTLPGPTGGSDPLEVEVDIRPRNSRNPVNLCSRGVLPVAILSSDTFDAAAVDPASVDVAGAAILARHRLNKKTGEVETKYRARVKDVNRDGLDDLLFLVRVPDLDPTLLEDGIAEVTGATLAGQKLAGGDKVTLVGAKRCCWWRHFHGRHDLDCPGPGKGHRHHDWDADDRDDD